MGPYINTNVVISHVMVHNDMVPFKVELISGNYLHLANNTVTLYYFRVV